MTRNPISPAAQSPELVDALRTGAAGVGELVDATASVDGVDTRWLAIARTHLQQGFMALERALTRPDRF